MIRNTAAIGETASFEIGHPLVLSALTKFIQQSGLPAPCFRHNPHDLSLPASTCSSSFEGGEFTLPAHKLA